MDFILRTYTQLVGLPCLVVRIIQGTPSSTVQGMNTHFTIPGLYSTRDNFQEISRNRTYTFDRQGRYSRAKRPDFSHKFSC